MEQRAWRWMKSLWRGVKRFFGGSQQQRLIAALKREKQRSAVAKKAKEEFLRNMSHDLRTPLTGIIGMAGILERSAQNPEEQERAHMLYSSGEQLLHLLNSVLGVVALDNPQHWRVQEETCNISRLLRGLADLELPAMMLKNIRFNLKLDDNVPLFIRTDGNKVHHILMNLLGNAIKFTERGTIELSAGLIYRHNKSYLQCRIQDSGCGIEPSHLKHIFKKFYRATPSSQGKYSGYGLGLYLVKQYTKMLQGTIAVESVVNQGSIFTLTLPVTVIAPAQTPPTKGIVLLVEDNPIALKTLELILKHHRIPYQSVISSTCAFALIQRTHLRSSSLI